MANEPLPFNGAGTPMKDLAPTVQSPYPDAPDPFAGPAAPKVDRARAKTVVRELPLVTVQNSWSVDQARGALYSHMTGIFETSSQLWDSILGDDRVMATLGSRVTGLLGREPCFAPANDSAAAKEVLDAWVAWWPKLVGDSAAANIHSTGIGMGFSPAQILWDTSGPVWGPRLRPWHTRYTYWDWSVWRFIALTQDGSVPIVAGNGKWFMYAPYGEYRGWIRGAIRAVAEPWMLRHFGFRDMARFSEVHGMPTRVGKVPAVSDPGERAAFETSLGQLGSDSAMIVPKGVDGANGDGYDYELVEAKDRAWESFGAMIDRCDMAIVLALLFQNLTTEVQTGSYAATQSHMDIRQGGLQFDNQAWKHALHLQVAKPFAYLNFGDADLAPMSWWDVTPREDLTRNADQFAKFGAAMQALTTAGVKFKDPSKLTAFVREMLGLRDFPELTIAAPAAPEAPGGGGDASF